MIGSGKGVSANVALLLQKNESRICLCTQRIAMLCGGVTGQIRFPLEHMQGLFERQCTQCACKLRVLNAGGSAAGSQGEH